MIKRFPLSRLLSSFAADRSRIETSLRGRARDEASDVMQDTWVKLATRSADGVIDNPSAYVTLVARNTATDHVRKERRRNAIDTEIRSLLWDSEDEFTPERILIGRQAATMLTDAIEELPTQTKRVFLMNRFEGLTHREIAETIGISEPAVYYHIRRALEHLSGVRQRLAD
jgi:RNA polymerase sigma-70 factor (ECF subfamily)